VGLTARARLERRAANLSSKYVKSRLTVFCLGHEADQPPSPTAVDAGRAIDGPLPPEP